MSSGSESVRDPDASADWMYTATMPTSIRSDPASVKITNLRVA